MQIWIGKMQAKKSPKNWIWEGLGLQLGGVWALFWALLGAFGPFFWCSKFNFFQAWVSMGPRWAPRGLWYRFWVDFGRIWGGIWKDLEPFEQGMVTFWICLAWFGLAAAELINWTPALIREASQCAGVPPRVVEQDCIWTYNGRLGGQAGQPGDRHPK